jgi:hypothetical protein
LRDGYLHACQGLRLLTERLTTEGLLLGHLSVTEGTSALFALTSGATAPDKAVDKLKHYDFEIISTNLPEEQENKLREAFAQE